jgi:hypothetical protein
VSGTLLPEPVRGRPPDGRRVVGAATALAVVVGFCVVTTAAAVVVGLTVVVVACTVVVVVGLTVVVVVGFMVVVVVGCTVVVVVGLTVVVVVGFTVVVVVGFTVEVVVVGFSVVVGWASTELAPDPGIPSTSMAAPASRLTSPASEFRRRVRESAIPSP